MTKFDRNKFMEEALIKDEESRAFWKSLIDQDGDYLDEDGYPTDLACECIRAWHWSDKAGFMSFIKNIWHLAEWGWSEVDEPHDWKAGEIVRRFHVSTAGWSGNESLIRAMKENTMLWHLLWVQSRRGGHYIFEIDREITK